MNPKWYTYVALTLLLGGLIAVGAAAGVRVAYAEAVTALEIPLYVPSAEPTAEQALLQSYNQTIKTLLVGGTVAIISGLGGLYTLRRTYNNE